MSDPVEPPFRLRRAEAVLRRRTSRLVLILERPWNDENVQAVVRTAESFGIQHIWTIEHSHPRRRTRRTVTKGSHNWVTRRRFQDTEECLAAVKEADLELWATDLARGADELVTAEVLRPFPERVAVVIGREMAGVSEPILEAADRRVYLPMHGFTESFNLSVATALVLQRCFDAEPGLVGGMGDEERSELRRDWYQRLAGKNDERKAEYARWAENPPEPNDSTRPSDESRAPRMKKRLRHLNDV